MPEAAEVSVAAAQLAHVAVGRVLEALPVTHPRAVRHLPDPTRLEDLVGRRVLAVGRHGKWLLVSLADTTDRLAVHLRMSGQLLAHDVGDPHPDRHVHATLTLGPRTTPALPVLGAPRAPEGAAGTGEQRTEVWFRDPRTFGELRVLGPGEVPVAADLFAADVGADTWAAASRRRRVGVKAVLLDQTRAVAGIGSYLGDEVLHDAGISPVRPADTLARSAWQRILDAARTRTLAAAAAGGVTLPDEGWVDLWGRPGRYATELRVHGRQRCATCATPTRRGVVGGRSARWCPRCQDARRRR